MSKELDDILERLYEFASHILLTSAEAILLHDIIIDYRDLLKDAHEEHDIGGEG